MVENKLLLEIEDINIHNVDDINDKIISAPAHAEQYTSDSKYKKDDDEEETETKSKTYNNSFKHVFFADFESFTANDTGANIIHDPFMLCYT